MLQILKGKVISKLMDSTDKEFSFLLEDDSVLTFSVNNENKTKYISGIVLENTLIETISSEKSEDDVTIKINNDIDIVFKVKNEEDIILKLNNKVISNTGC